MEKLIAKIQSAHTEALDQLMDQLDELTHRVGWDAAGDLQHEIGDDAYVVDEIMDEVVALLYTEIKRRVGND